MVLEYYLTTFLKKGIIGGPLLSDTRFFEKTGCLAWLGGSKPGF
jgi:hypothetical protein